MWYVRRMPYEPSLDEVVRWNIRDRMTRTATTQAELVAELGTNPTWLWRRIRPNKPAPITFTELEAIAYVLGVTPAELITR